MKNVLITLTCFIILGVFSKTSATDNQTNRYRVTVTTKENVDLLLKQGVDIVATKFGESIDIRCLEEKAVKLAELGFKITLLQKTDQLAFAIPQGFHNYQETKKFLQQRTALFSDISRLDSVGASVENRAIWAMKISDNPDKDEDEPCFLVEGCIHGNENHALEACLFFIDYLLNNYGTNPEVTHWVNNREIWVVPLVNPDGHERNKRRNVNNVDLNRNFGYWWSFAASGYGSTPFSEPETQAIRDLVLAIKPYGSLAFHTSGRLVIYPWAYIDQTTPDSNLFEKVSAEVIDSINMVDPQIQYQSRLSGSWYWHGGEHNDWMYSQYGMLSMTVELMTSQSAPPSDHENEVILPAFRVMLRRPEKSGITGIITDDFTGNPVQATVKIVELFDEEQLQRRRSEPIFGRYLRFLTPGSYTLEISAPEFQTIVRKITIDQSEVVDTLNFKLSKNIISLANVQVDDSKDGNNNGLLNRGEKIQFNISARNTGRANAGNVYGILQSESPFLSFTRDSVFWGDIDSTQTNIVGNNSFEIIVSPDVMPGEELQFKISFFDNNGNIWNSKFSQSVQGFFDQVVMNEPSQWTHQMIQTQDDWQRGIPNGKVDDPAAAFSPDFCWGNDLGGSGWNGEYKNNVDNILQMRTLDCTGWDAVYLQFYRWLNVLGGDKVYISVNDQIIWENYNFGIRDTSWSEQIVDISPIAGNNDSVVIRFGLQTNGSGTAGGWNIDDIIVDSSIILAVNSNETNRYPDEFRLYQNYPNPFNQSTSIQYYLVSGGKVSIRIFDLLGREVNKLIDKNQVTGLYTIAWDGKDRNGKDVASGLYFVNYSVSANENNSYYQVRKLMLVR